MHARHHQSRGFRTVWLTLWLACFLHIPGLAASAPTSPLPGDSVYRLNAALTDHNGREFGLQSLRGRPILVSMIYNSCTFVCPMLIDTMGLIRDNLSDQEKAGLPALLITFDPQRDDVSSLKAVLDKRGLDPLQWTLARSDESSTRKIAAALGIQYRRLPDGEFNHTTIVLLLDADGRIVGRSRKMGALDPTFVKLIRSTLSASVGH